MIPTSLLIVLVWPHSLWMVSHSCPATDEASFFWVGSADPVGLDTFPSWSACRISVSRSGWGDMWAISGKLEIITLVQFRDLVLSPLELNVHPPPPLPEWQVSGVSLLPSARTAAGGWLGSDTSLRRTLISGWADCSIRAHRLVTSPGPLGIRETCASVGIQSASPVGRHRKFPGMRSGLPRFALWLGQEKMNSRVIKITPIDNKAGWTIVSNQYTSVFLLRWCFVPSPIKAA